MRLFVLLLIACSGSSNTATPSSYSPDSFNTACTERRKGDAATCGPSDRCNALYTCITTVIAPEYQDAVLRCEAETCATDKRACITKVAEGVTDQTARIWEATCDNRAAAAKVSDDSCQGGGATYTPAYRDEFDRCLSLAEQAKRDECIATLNAVCDSTYF